MTTMNKSPFTRRKLRKACKALFADTERQLNRELGSWAGTFKLDPDQTYLSVWDHEGEIRVQVGGYFTFNPGGIDLTLPVIMSHPKEFSFEGKEFSQSFREDWFRVLVDRMNSEMARGWEFDMGRPDAEDFLKPWETVSYDSFTSTSFRAYVLNEFTGEEDRAATVTYSPLGLDEAAGTIRAGVLSDTAVRASTLLSYGAVLAASGDQDYSTTWLRRAGENDYISESWTPEVWFAHNYGPDSNRPVGHIRGPAVRALGAYETPVLHVFAGTDLCRSVSIGDAKPAATA